MILVVVDTLRADHLSCYGYGRPTSPSVDRLAEDGALFENVVAASAFTGPSVASILTGKYPRFHSFGYANGMRLLVPDEVTLAERFRDAGYTTGAIVCNPVLPPAQGFHQGFETYDLKQVETRRGPRFQQRVAPAATAAAMEWLEQLDADERVFLYLHYMDPHGPYSPPAEFAERFAPDEPGPVVPESDDMERNSGEGFVPAYQRLDGVRHLNEFVARYDAEIAFFDRSFGKLLDWLEDSGRYEDAVILFTADHGEALGENGYYFAHGHAVTPDQSFVPLIFKHPDVQPGGRVTTTVGHVDVFRTLTAELGDAPAAQRWDRPADLLEVAAGQVPDRAVFCDQGNLLGVHVGGLGQVGVVSSPGPGGERDFRPTALVDPRGADIVREAGLDLPRHAEQVQRYLAEPSRVMEAIELDEEMRASLRELGYTDE